MSALQTIWYFLIGVLLTGYALLDGFDLGTGWWVLREKDPQRRRMQRRRARALPRPRSSRQRLGEQCPRQPHPLPRRISVRSS